MMQKFQQEKTMNINMLKQCALIMRLDKPIGIFLTLWPSLWALWFATKGHPSWAILSIIIVGAILVRSAGCVINDILDRNIDHQVTRTQHRPLTSGKMSLRQAIFLFAILGATSLSLTFCLNTLSIFIALTAGLLTLLYPLAKRITYFPQIILGITFNAGVLIAFSATQNTVPSAAWLLYTITIIWTVAYDTLYAMSDREDDLNIGIKSTAILFAKKDRLIVGILQIITLGLLALLGYRFSCHFYYYFGLIIAASLVIYQQKLIKNRSPEQCLKAFLNNHWLGMIIFIGIFLNFV